MVDKYIEKLADVLVKHSFRDVDFESAWEDEGKRMYITSLGLAGEELARYVSEKIWDKGGDVAINLVPDWSDREYFNRASDSVIGAEPGKYEYAKVDNMCARLVILAEENTKANSSINPAKKAKKAEANKSIRERLLAADKYANFILPWCATMVPTQGYAQDMGVPLEEYSDKLYSAMLLDEEDPVAAWKNVRENQEKMIKDVLEGAKKIGIYAEDGTSLEMSVEGHHWIACDGTLNFPDGERFTAPRWQSVNGTVKFLKLPQSNHGSPEVRGITMKFENGEVSEYHAEKGEDYLTKFLEENENANKLGEIAFGDNPNVKDISGQILLDEKMGGAVHMALGTAFELNVLGDGDKSGLNKSPVHWDLIKDMKAEGSYAMIDDEHKITWDDKEKKWVY